MYSTCLNTCGVAGELLFVSFGLRDRCSGVGATPPLGAEPGVEPRPHGWRPCILKPLNTTSARPRRYMGGEWGVAPQHRVNCGVPPPTDSRPSWLVDSPQFFFNLFRTELTPMRSPLRKLRPPLWLTMPALSCPSSRGVYACTRV